MQRVGKPVKSVKYKALHIDQFNCVTYDAESLQKLRRKIAISRKFKTHVKLSRDGWRDSGSGFFSRGKLKRMSVPLDDIQCLIRDEFSDDVLFCVFNLRLRSEAARYSIVAYKFRDAAVISNLGELFSELLGEAVEEDSDPITGGVVMWRRTVNSDIQITSVSRPTSPTSPLPRHLSSLSSLSSSRVYLPHVTTLFSDDDDDEESQGIDHVFDDVFERNQYDLSKKIYPSQGLLTILRDKHVLTSEQIQDIKAQKNDEEKTIRMMELLKKRPDSCFDNFVQALDKTEQGHIAKFLRRASMKRLASTSAAENQRPNTVTPDLQRNAESAQHSVDFHRSTSGYASNSSLSYAPAGSQLSLGNSSATGTRTPKSILRSNTGTGSEFGSRSNVCFPSYESLGSRFQYISRL